MKWHSAVMVLAAALLASGPVRAKDQYPASAITVVVPLAPGTTADILARLFGEEMSNRFGQQVIVSNRPGAGGLIAAQAVASAPADGYTLLLANSGHAILGALNKKLPFDPIGDFAGVSMIGEAAAIAVAPPSLGTRDLKAFVGLAKASPGSINYGSAGIGTATHIAGAYFAKQAGIEMVHVPYKTGSALIADLVASRIQVTFAPAAFTLPMLQDGKLVALAVASREPMRSPVAVPSAVSSGVDYEYATWYGFLAPARTPKPILQTLSTAISQVEPQLRANIISQGIEPRTVALAAFDTHIRQEMTRLAPLLKGMGDQVGN